MSGARPETLTAIKAAADEEYDKHPGGPLPPEAVERMRRLLPPAAERETAA